MATQSKGPNNQPATRAVSQPPGRMTSCPNCGAHRVGEFRFCRSCGLDFDLAEQASVVQPWLSEERSRGTVRSMEPPVMLHSAGASRADAPDRTPRSRPGSTVGAGRYTLAARQILIVAVGVALAAAVIVAVIAR